ncbi:hypothetical protein DOJK_00884 [Patescibacteria group bacterium]|nr:hypothetical protein DOJK_00884 [Patescibacteria group bacterium]
MSGNTKVMRTIPDDLVETVRSAVRASLPPHCAIEKFEKTAFMAQEHSELDIEEVPEFFVTGIMLAPKARMNFTTRVIRICRGAYIATDVTILNFVWTEPMPGQPAWC